MRREALAIVVLLILASCRDDAETRSCDLDTLTELADALGRMSVAEQANHVWPGLVDACGNAIPGPFYFYFDPDTLGGTFPRERDFWSAMLQHRTCPGWDELARANEGSGSLGTVAFDGCDFARYEVLAIEEVTGRWSPIMIFATHQWLLDVGLDPGVAKPITRSLYALDEMRGWPISPMDELRWPKAHGVPMRGGVPIYVTPSYITSGKRRRVSLDNVDSEHDLAEILAKEVTRLDREQDEPLLIVADAETPMATIMGLIHAAERVSFTRYGFFVEPETFVPTYLPVALARGSLSSSELEPLRTLTVMSIEFTPEGLTLSRGRAQGPTPQVLAFTELDAVSNFAREVHRDAPEARRVVVSAAGTVPLEPVLAVIAAARGPECSETGDGCVLPDVVVMQEQAHRYFELPSIHDTSAP